jgi:putative ABC transport system permease protein
MACMVAHRTREIGIRIALGAPRAAVLTLVLRESALLVASGVVAGSAAALAATRLIRTALFGIGASDPPTYGAIALALASVALVSAWLPARRAARVDPAVALRHS